MDDFSSVEHELRDRYLELPQLDSSSEERLRRNVSSRFAPRAPSKGHRPPPQQQTQILNSNAMPGRRRRRILAMGATLAAAVVLLTVQPWQATHRDDTARAAEMVTLQPRTILHVRAEGHRIYTPFWEQWLAPDGSWRDKHGGSSAAGPCTVENSFDADTHVISTYDATTHRIYRSTLRAATWFGPIDQVAQIRGWLNNGQLHAVGHARIEGRDVTRLLPTHGKDLRGVQAYYIDARTYAPVRWQIDATQWYDFTIYERLPGNALNDALTSVRAQHPNAGYHPGVRPTCSSG